uniref:Uncharacterized protein n=2 Tax=Oryza meridionalis TaxID=40149 RepID=A0A0E0CJZ3_9ORYZ
MRAHSSCRVISVTPPQRIAVASHHVKAGVEQAGRPWTAVPNALDRRSAVDNVLNLLQIKILPCPSPLSSIMIDILSTLSKTNHSFAVAEGKPQLVSLAQAGNEISHEKLHLKSEEVTTAMDNNGGDSASRSLKRSGPFADITNVIDAMLTNKRAAVNQNEINVPKDHDNCEQINKDSTDKIQTASTIGFGSLLIIAFATVIYKWLSKGGLAAHEAVRC